MQIFKLANKALEIATNEISCLYPDAFGNSMLRYDALHIEGITTAHRFRSQFQVPDSTNDRLMEEKAFKSWLEYDHNLKPANWLKANERTLLHNARSWLHEHLRKFKLSQDIEISPGETFKSARGETSVYQKLSKKKYWTVTSDAADDFIRLCYNNLMLKRVAKSHMRKRTPLELQRLYRYELIKGSKHVGFAIFRRLMYSDVLTIVMGSRASSVPKNNEKRRFINVEPLGNVILQRQVALGLREVLSALGNDLETGQLDHYNMISDKSYATIDFSNASDSVILSWVKWFFPRPVYKYLFRYRSHITYVDSVAHAPNKLSSMGNGFTFEVMTMMLLAIARSLDLSARVYGDDVIIHNLVADQFITAAADIGFQVNDSKTFVRSPFRESCGGFYHDDIGYLTTFDFQYIENWESFVVSCNKAYLISKRCKNPEVRRVTLQLYKTLLELAPTKLIGPDHSKFCQNKETLPNYSEAMRPLTLRDTLAEEGLWTKPALGLNSYIFCRNWNKYHQNRDETSLRLRNLLVKSWQLGSDDPKKPALAEISIWRFVNEEVTPAYHNIRKDPARVAAYFYGLRRCKDVNRNRGKWVETLYFVSASGSSIAVADVGKYYKD